MKFSRVISLGKTGLFGFETFIETDVQQGLFHFYIIGLADKTVEESKQRILSAIKNSGFTSPKTAHQKIITSLVPSDIKKEGAHYDIPIAISYLQATGFINKNIDKYIFIGELSLDGRLRSVRNALFFAHLAQSRGYKHIILPQIDAYVAPLITNICVYTFSTLKEVVDFLNSKKIPDIDLKNKIKHSRTKSISAPKRSATKEYIIDTIKGQKQTKRMLEICLAGRHHMLMSGPPGVGKSMLAKASAELLPTLDGDALIQKMIIHDAFDTQRSNTSFDTKAPFRSPHHTSSYTSIIGNKNQVGEICLAHNGILFMDEIAEFDRRALESIRQSLETKTRSIKDDKHTIELPCDFILISATNPCPCGNYQSIQRRCVCAPHIALRYSQKISGPILDRIDLYLRVDVEHGGTIEKTGEQMRKRIQKVREIQTMRMQAHNNQREGIIAWCKKSLSPDCMNIIISTTKQYSLSQRAVNSIILVSRTIADLDDSNNIKEPHILEALLYRKR